MNVRVADTEVAPALTKANLAPLLLSIENLALRQYCVEQVAASETASEVDAAFRLVMELASSVRAAASAH